MALKQPQPDEDVYVMKIHGSVRLYAELGIIYWFKLLGVHSL